MSTEDLVRECMAWGNFKFFDCKWRNGEFCGFLGRAGLRPWAAVPADQTGQTRHRPVGHKDLNCSCLTSAPYCQLNFAFFWNCFVFLPGKGNQTPSVGFSFKEMLGYSLTFDILFPFSPAGLKFIPVLQEKYNL